MFDLKRRDFLKIIGLAGTGAVTGCSSDTPNRLVPYIFPPEDIIPGEAVWYASTCRGCPAGCGLLAKNRDGRVVKLEGNPFHPVSQGKLCARGQASLQGLYNPDRFPGPFKRQANGKLASVTWQQGEELLVRNLTDLIRQGRGERVVFVTELITGSLKGLVDRWLSEMGSRGPLCYESFAYEPLRLANRLVFQYDGLPHYRLDQADFLISFGAGFLETWISNLEFARQFSIFHALKPQGKNPFIFVGPRLSLTANNADQWIAVPPGEEYLIGLGMLRVLLDEGWINNFSPDQQEWLRKTLQDFTLEQIQQKTGVRIQVIRDLARRFSRAQKPLALAEGLGLSGPHALDAAVAANLLCLIKPGSFDTIDFNSPLAYGQTAPLAAIKELSERMKKKEIDLLLLGQVNPVFNLPFSEEFRQGLNSVPLVVSFSSYPDETSTLAGLVLPNHTFLESWGDYSPREGVSGLMQPVMGPVFQTRAFRGSPYFLRQKGQGAG